MKFTPSRRTLIVILAAAALLMMAYATLSQKAAEWPYTVIDTAEDIPISEAHALITEAAEGRMASILDSHVYIRTPVVNAADASGQDAQAEDPAEGTASAEGTAYSSVRARLPYPAHEMILSMVEDAEVPITIERNPGYEATLADRIFQLLPLLLIFGFVALFISRGVGRSLGLDSSFTVINPEDLPHGFEGVAGIDVAREEINEIVEYLRDPAAATRLGAKIPKGALFSGSPGNGKTLLARAMAKEAGVPFITIEASGVNQLFVGAGAMKIKRAFREARKMAPCIVFIDEIDAMGRARGNSQSGAGDEKDTTLNQLLIELDGFDSREGVILIAATNRKEILDKALTRRGRIDLHVQIDDPDIAGRRDILEVHRKSIISDPALDVNEIARSTPGFTGADLASLTNEAARNATRLHRDATTLEDYVVARDKMLLPQSGSVRRLDEKTRMTVAYHEAGHAFIAAALAEADPIEKATILPRGGALGYVLQFPLDDRLLYSRDELIARIRVAVAGRVAEELKFGYGAMTNGAASDIEAATRIARAMVVNYGMSDNGFVQLDPQDPALFDMKGSALKSIREIIEREKALVRMFLEGQMAVLDQIADLLLEEETVAGARITKLIEDAEVSFKITT